MASSRSVREEFSAMAFTIHSSECNPRAASKQASKQATDRFGTKSSLCFTLIAHMLKNRVRVLLGVCLSLRDPVCSDIASSQWQS